MYIPRKKASCEIIEATLMNKRRRREEEEETDRHSDRPTDRQTETHKKNNKKAESIIERPKVSYSFAKVERDNTHVSH